VRDGGGAQARLVGEGGALDADDEDADDAARDALRGERAVEDEAERLGMALRFAARTMRQQLT
jgi:hypothetical protein